MEIAIYVILGIVCFILVFIILFFSMLNSDLIRLFHSLNDLWNKLHQLDRDIVNSGSLSEEVLQMREDDKRCKNLIKDYLEEIKKK